MVGLLFVDTVVTGAVEMDEGVIRSELQALMTTNDAVAKRATVPLFAGRNDRCAVLLRFVSLCFVSLGFMVGDVIAKTRR